MKSFIWREANRSFGPKRYYFVRVVFVVASAKPIVRREFGLYPNEGRKIELRKFDVFVCTYILPQTELKAGKLKKQRRTKLEYVQSEWQRNDQFLARIECMKCGLLRSMFPASVSLSVCQCLSVCLLSSLLDCAVQTRLNGSRSCLGWKLLAIHRILY